MTKFKAMKIRINNPDHSKAVQEWLFEQGYGWCDGKHTQHIEAPYLYVDGEDGCVCYSHEGTDNFFNSDDGKEIDVQHLDPRLKKLSMKSELEKLSTQLKHLDKSIASHDNKQNKRKLDRQRIIEKMEGMLPDGYGICLTGGVSEYHESLEEGWAREIIAGSVWECVDNDGDGHLTVGREYKVLYLDEDNDPGFENDVANDVWTKEEFLQCFKRVK